MRFTCHRLHELAASAPTVRPRDSSSTTPSGHSPPTRVLWFFAYALLFIVPIAIVCTLPAYASTTTVSVYPIANCFSACPANVTLNPGTHVLTWRSGSWSSWASNSSCNGIPGACWLGYVYVDLSSPFEYHTLGKYNGWYNPAYYSPEAAEAAATGSTLVLSITGAPRTVSFYCDIVGQCSPYSGCKDNRGGPIVIDIQSTETPAFEIVSATFDSWLYVPGSVAHLSVTIQSNWASGSYTVTPLISPHCAPAVPLNSQAASLTPGGEQTLSFLWTVPQLQAPQNVDVAVNAAGIDALFPNATTITQISQEDRDAVQGRATACGATATELCGDFVPGLLTAVIPFAGTLACSQDEADYACLAVQYLTSGRGLQAGTMALAAALNLVACIYGAVGDVAVAFSGQIEIKAVDLLAATVTGWLPCLTAWEDLATGPGGQARLLSAGADTPLVSRLADSLQTAMHDANMVCADVALVQGHAGLRILCDDAWTSVDSVGNRDVAVVKIADGQAMCGLVFPGATRFQSESVNAANAATIRVEADSSDTCYFVLLHQGSDGALVKLEYAPIPVDSGSVAEVAVALNSTSFLLNVDRDGDGLVDLIYYPGGDVTAVLGEVGSGPPTAIRATAVPNPTHGPVLFVLEAARPLSGVGIEIFDVSGRKVRLIRVNGQAAGTRSIAWDGRSDVGALVASGVYFYRVFTDQGVASSKKMLILR